jgi:hypothetical protein
MINIHVRFITKTDMVSKTLTPWKVENNLSFPLSLALFVASIIPLHINPDRKVNVPTTQGIAVLEPSRKVAIRNKIPATVIDLNSFGKSDLSIIGLFSSGKSLNTVGATNADWNNISPHIRPEIKTCVCIIT